MSDNYNKFEITTQKQANINQIKQEIKTEIIEKQIRFNHPNPWVFTHNMSTISANTNQIISFQCANNNQEIRLKEIATFEQI